MTPAAYNLCLEMLADDEATLRAQVLDLEIENQIFFEALAVAFDQLHKVTGERDRARAYLREYTQRAREQRRAA